MPFRIVSYHFAQVFPNLKNPFVQLEMVSYSFAQKYTGALELTPIYNIIMVYIRVHFVPNTTTNILEVILWQAHITKRLPVST